MKSRFRSLQTNPPALQGFYDPTNLLWLSEAWDILK